MIMVKRTYYILGLVLLAGLSYAISVIIFLFGFFITPNSGVVNGPLKFGDGPTFFTLERHVQDLVVVVLPCSLVVGAVFVILGVTMRRASAVMFALNGVYWLVLLGVYFAGIAAGAFDV